MRRFLILPIALLSTACDDAGGELRMPDGTLPAAAEVAPGMEGLTLEDQLQELEKELVRAREGEPERLLTAEAITDRLVHAERGVDWLGSGYDVEARLRQLQAMADRVLARLRRGSDVRTVSEDVALILAAVRDLQRHLELPGGGAAPPALDVLLAQDPLRDVQAGSLGSVDASSDTTEQPNMASQTARPSGPLGTPVSRDTTPDI